MLGIDLLTYMPPWHFSWIPEHTMTLFHNRACFLYQMQLRWKDSNEYSVQCAGKLSRQIQEPIIVSN